MSRPLSDQGVARLTQLSAARDRTGYYEALKQETDDPYADLALGVVKQSEISGRVARNFAIEVGRRYCRLIGGRAWLGISEDLMRADLAARVIARNQTPGSGELPWLTIRDYHVAVFAQPEFGLPPFAWTAWIPLEVQRDDASRAALWRRMLTETILPVGIETLATVLATLPLRRLPQGLFDIVVPTIHWHPPLATGITGSPAFDRCMSAMTAFQLENAAALSRDQHYALFYLDVLSTNAATLRSAAAIAPTSAWRSITGPAAVVRVPTRPQLRVTPGPV